MIWKITNDEYLQKSINALGEYITFTGNEVNVTAVNEGVGYSVEWGENPVVKYGSISDFFRAVAWMESLKTPQNTQNRVVFEHLGIMVDCARGAVPTVDGLKRFIAKAVLCGYNYVGLYLEDCLEVDGEPLFGYMRGRYTVNEIQELVSFADQLGVEIVPYVQTLAHLPRIFNHWDPYFKDVRDVNDILLIGAPRTYELIDNMLSAASVAFKTRRINLGMDEAFMMGLGKFRELNGVRDRVEIFTEHIKKVLEIAQKYGFKPTIWADMYNHYATENSSLTVPEGLGLTEWEYCATEEEYYAQRIDKTKQLSGEVCFAGCAHRHYGFTPLNEYSYYTAIPAMRAAKGRVNDFCMTMWGDDGAECSYNALWYALITASGEAFDKKRGKRESDRLARIITGYSLNELLALDYPNKVFDCPAKRPTNVSKYLLYEDPFMGIADRNTCLLYDEYFARHAKLLKKLARRKSEYSYLFKEMAALASVLEYKGSLRLALVDAYNNKDKEALTQIANIRYAKVIGKIEAFYTALKARWDKENKPFGFEVMDVRFGGLVLRLKHERDILKDYLYGKADSIPALEQKNMSPALWEDEYNGALCFNSYEQSVTYSGLSIRIFN